MLGHVISRGVSRWMLVLLAAPLLWFALPKAHQRQFAQAFSPSTYRLGAQSTIGSRLIVWRKTVDMIARRPLFGCGYGFESFEALFNRESPPGSVQLEGTSHAHNQWLEIAAEAGIPAALVFLAFTVVRIALMAASWRAAAHRAGAGTAAGVILLWLALEAAIQVYGLTNYTLRRNMGLFTYGLWGIGVAMSVRLLREADSRAAPALNGED
jgi:O-antigen ligase